MSTLAAKTRRDLWRIKWQALAIAVLIGAGVAVSVMAYSSQEALQAARKAYYAQTRFADVFAGLVRAPLNIAERAQAIEGVTAVDPRIVKAGLMQVPGLVRPAIARLVSLPVAERGALNRIRVMQGRLPAPGASDEAVALRTFLDATGVRLGDRLSTVIAGRRISIVIVGAALAPEYVFVPAPDSAMPDDRHQGVFWLNRDALEHAADMDGAFNALALTLAPSASQEAVIAAVDRLLAAYGGTPAIGRADQVSNAFLDAEFKELATSGMIFPPIFLAVAAALVHLVMSRLVEAQREQIGLLKAFGYSSFAAAAPIAAMAGVIGLVGALLGGVIGYGFAIGITDLYADYMRFPVLEPRFNWLSFAGAAGVGVAACVAGATIAALRAARLSPSVAMAPPSPARYQLGPLDRLTRMIGLTGPAKMVLRGLERRPWRAATTTAGFAVSIGLLLATQFIFDALDEVLDHAYFRAQRWSDIAAFAEPRDVTAVHAIARLPGVLAAEPVRVVPATLASALRRERMALTGLEVDATLAGPLNDQGAAIPLAGEGLVISQALANRLGVVQGERVLVEITEGRRPSLYLTVRALTKDYSGLSAYLERRALNRLLKEGDIATGAMLIVDPSTRRDFYAALSDTPMIAGASSRDDTVASYRVTMTQAFRSTIIFYALFAGAIALGVAYNAARISLSENARDLATLEVLGFTHGEILQIQLGELILLALASIPIGVALGWALANGVSLAYGRDEMRIPATVTPRAIGFAILVFAAAVASTALLIARRVTQLNLVTVLKTRE